MNMYTKMEVEYMKKGSMKKKIILSVISGIIFTAVSFYVTLPAINPANPSFWGYIALVILSFAYPFIFQGDGKVKKKKVLSIDKEGVVDFDMPKGRVRALPTTLVLAPVAIMLIGGIISSTFFNAKAYADVIEVKEAVFAEDMKETNEVTNIALMDGDSARIIGNRTLGSLSDVVSQYRISDIYTQINYKYTPKKVANLEHDDFFKWIANNAKGVPGYVMVDPVNNTAEYVKLEKPLKYVDSAYFGQDLMRKLRFDYPTKIFDDFVSFEIDEEGKPHYIISCLMPKIFPFGAMDVSEVIIFDPCTGESDIYAVGDVPAWVDAVYSGDLAEQKYNWHGTLAGGFWNSVIGNKDCKQTTDDYGYIVIGDDVWYFTGVTSVTADESNIGFIISNARTGEYKYYPVVGAEEYSAMRAAEGEVQEKGYVASFPSLINVEGQATYIMVLKDAGGLVKLYALVNVEQYGIVATGQNQAEAMKAYKALLLENGVVENVKPEEPELDVTYKTGTVTDIRTVTVEGNTLFYVTLNGYVYRGSVKVGEYGYVNEDLVFAKVGDTVTIVFSKGYADGAIREIIDFRLGDWDIDPAPNNN